jgi:hypothetical protein
MHLNKCLSSACASTLLGLALLSPSAQAAQPSSSLTVVPTINTLNVVNGQLLASGVATATVRGKMFTAPFTNVPVNVALAPDQTAATPGCPILDLQLAPINLDLLGLVVQTSPICLTVTANPAGGLLGNLLCSVANLLSQGLSLDQVLGTLNSTQLASLTTGLTDLLNAALQNLLQATLVGISPGQAPGQCSVLDLALGPLNLNLLGLNVVLDNCSNGPVIVTITAQHGELLGNLLCSLVNQGQINIGSLLGSLIGQLLNLGPL